MLSLQLPFAIVPLIRLTSSRAWMGDLASNAWLKTGATVCALLIVALNLLLVGKTIVDLEARAPWLAVCMGVLLLGSTALLVHITTVALGAATRPAVDDR